RGFGPTGNGDASVTSINANRNPTRKLSTCTPYQLRVANGGGTENHPPDAHLQPCLDCRHVADAAAELNRDRYCSKDRFDRGNIDRFTRHRSVEIDHVQVAEALLLEQARLIRRRIAVDGLRRHVAAQKPDTTAILEIDCRKQDHVRGSSGESWRSG